MAKIYSPNKKYNGETAGVTFVNGAGETDNVYLLDYFKNKGYEVDESKKDNTDGELDTLKAEATALGIKFQNNIGKAKLIEKIKEAKELQLPKGENNQKGNPEDNSTDEDIFED